MGIDPAEPDLEPIQQGGYARTRVAELERQVDAMNRLLRELVTRLEQRLGEDVDRDGKIG